MFLPRAKAASAKLTGPDSASLPDSNRWCAPYGYKENQDAGCGGADRWILDSLHGNAVPGLGEQNVTWNIYCPPKMYCPKTTEPPKECEAGHYCRKGSHEMSTCRQAALLECPPGTGVPQTNVAWLTFAMMLLVVLGFIWQISYLYNKIQKRMSYKDRLVFTWGMRPEISVVPNTAASAADSGSRRAPANCERAKSVCYREEKSQSHRSCLCLHLFL